MQSIKILPVFFYKESSGNEPVKKWLRELSAKDRKIIGADIREVQIDWPIGMPLVKPLGNKLWEIRSNLDNRIARTMFILHEDHLVLLHGIIKKSQKTPSDDIAIALKRAKKYIAEKS